MISFNFEGKNYTAPMGFYDTNVARLPDGRFVEVHGWLESTPTQPMVLKVVLSKGQSFVDAQAA